MELASIIQPSLYGCRSAQLPGCHESPHAAHWRDLHCFSRRIQIAPRSPQQGLYTFVRQKTRWKPRTRMYARSWTTSENLCNRKTKLFLCIVHAYRLTEGHLINSSRRDITNQHNNITTSTTKSPPAQQHHQRNEITTKSPAQWNHQRNKITSTTTSPAQRKHQHNEITSEQHQRNNITRHNEINSTTKSPAQRYAPAQQHHQLNESTSTTKSPVRQQHQRKKITSTNEII